MALYKLTSEAKTDLINIRRYTLNTWGSAQWGLYSLQLKSSMKLLASNPSIGTVCDDIRVDFYRLPLKNHTIYFKRNEDFIVVVRILQNSMCPNKHLT
jgi:toxin ParE1/3/4